VRTGMAFLSRLPGLVVVRPCGCLKRAGARQRSMVERLILNSNALVSGVSCSSPQRSNTLTISGRKGCNRFEQIRPHTSQICSRATTTSP